MRWPSIRAPKTHAAAQWAVRFVLGGLVGVAAGIVGTVWGPYAGGILLGFPSIAAATLTLLQQEKGRGAAGADAVGMVMGGTGLVTFAAVCAFALGRAAPGWLAVLLASVCWVTVSVGLWTVHQCVRASRRARGRGDDAGDGASAES